MKMTLKLSNEELKTIIINWVESNYPENIIVKGFEPGVAFLEEEDGEGLYAEVTFFEKNPFIDAPKSPFR